MAKKNSKLIIGISVGVVILIAIGIFLFYPTAENLNPVTSEDKSKSTTSYFSRDSGGNYVPSTAEVTATPQDSNILTQPAQSKIEYPPEKPQDTIIQAPAQLKGAIVSLNINKNTYTVGEQIIVTGRFRADADGNYYIEFGLDRATRQPLALTGTASACDTNRNYAGAWYKNARAGDFVDFELRIQNYGNEETGKYKIVGGVYSGCSGDTIVNVKPYEISIYSPQPQVIVTPTPAYSNLIPPSPTQPAICNPSGYFKELWVRKVGAIGYDTHSSFSYSQRDNSQPRVIGIFKNNAPCTVTYYIESGMLESSFRAPLAVMPFIPTTLTGKSGACDTNIHFSGTMVTLKSGEEVGFALYPQNFGKAGTFTLLSGVFNTNGVFCKTNSIVNVPNLEIQFIQYGSSFQTDTSWVKVI